MMLVKIRKETRKTADPKRAALLRRFFKTGPGEYGEGDVFLGLTVPQSREIAKKYSDLKLAEAEKLIHSKIHEERLIALLILVIKFKSSDEGDREKIYHFYLKNTKFINNWDLVDLSADKIVGSYLLDKNKNILTQLAHSKNVWERRIAVLATFDFIKNSKFSDALKIARILLNDSHDLIHKAVGWMLREVGKKSLKTEEKFLRPHYKKMPRTMLRYAIEKFPEKKRQKYLKGEV